MAIDIQKIFYKMIMVAVVVLTLAYIFWSNDIIPDKFSPVSITTHIDDIGVAILGVIIFKRYKDLAFGNKKKKEKGNLLVAITWTAMLLFGIFYWFWGSDFVYDSLGWIGRIDDISFAFAGIFAAGKLKQWIRRK